MTIRPVVFGLAASLLWAASADAHPGVGIVMDRKGNVFYTDLAQVWRVRPDGTKSVAVRGVHTHELCLDGDDNLYGEHLWYEGDKTKKWGHRVWRLSPDGNLTDVIPASEGFLTGYSFVRDRAGTMYWVEPGRPTAFRVRTASGQIRTLSECRDCQDVRWMKATVDGTLLFVDNDSLREVDSHGVIHTRATRLPERRWAQFFVNDNHVVMGLWTDPARNVYVAVYGAGLVKRVRADGTVEIAARTPWPWSPTGGLVAPDGDLWLLEYSITGAARVRRIGAGGRSTVF